MNGTKMKNKRFMIFLVNQMTLKKLWINKILKKNEKRYGICIITTEIITGQIKKNMTNQLKKLINKLMKLISMELILIKR